MSAYKNKTYSLRINNDLQAKIEYIAKKEDRKISQQYERIIKNYIKEYEEINGELIVEENGTVHPKSKKEKSSISKSG